MGVSLTSNLQVLCNLLRKQQRLCGKRPPKSSNVQTTKGPYGIGVLASDDGHTYIFNVTREVGKLIVKVAGCCRKFPLLLTQDDFILKHVNFDIELEFKNLKRYQHINSLLVKCSEAGNIAAQCLLGKGILVSSSQLLLGEWEKVVGSFMAYFLPKQVSTSEFSDKIGSLPACEVVLALRQPS